MIDASAHQARSMRIFRFSLHFHKDPTSFYADMTIKLMQKLFAMIRLPLKVCGNVNRIASVDFGLMIWTYLLYLTIWHSMELSPHSICIVTERTRTRTALYFVYHKRIGSYDEFEELHYKN